MVPHASSTSGFSAEWLFLVPAHPSPCWMSRGDAGDIHKLFIWCITPLKQGNYSAAPGLAPQQSCSIFVRRAGCGIQGLPASLNWISFHFVSAELLECVPRVPFLEHLGRVCPACVCSQLINNQQRLMNKSLL